MHPEVSPSMIPEPSVLLNEWLKTLPDFDLACARFWPISKTWISPTLIYGFRPELEAQTCVVQACGL